MDRDTDYEEVKGYELLIHNESLILLFGFNQERGYQEYHWAGNAPEELLAAVDRSKKNVLISFVPKDWVDGFHQFGFRTYAVFRDYFNPDITQIKKSFYSYELQEEMTDGSQGM